MYWMIFYIFGGTGFVLACLLFLSIFAEEKANPAAPRPMFLVNLAAMALLVGIAIRCGEWLGQQITAEEFAKIGKVSSH